MNEIIQSSNNLFGINIQLQWMVNMLLSLRNIIGIDCSVLIGYFTIWFSFILWCVTWNVSARFCGDFPMPYTLYAWVNVHMWYWFKFQHLAGKTIKHLLPLVFLHMRCIPTCSTALVMADLSSETYCLLQCYNRNKSLSSTYRVVNSCHVNAPVAEGGK